MVRISFSSLCAHLAIVTIATASIENLAAADHFEATSILHGEILSTLRKQDESIQSFKVTYQVVKTLAASAADARKYTKLSALPDNRSETFAMKGRLLYFSFSEGNNPAASTIETTSLAQLAGEPNAAPVRSPANDTSAFDGETFQRRPPGGRQGIIIPGASVRTLSEYKPTYLQFCGRWPLDVRDSETPQPEWRLSDAIAAQQCTLIETFEDVDGNACYVIDWKRSSRTTVWCDPQIGFAVRKLKVRHTDSERPKTLSVCSDFVRHEGDIWFPQLIETDRYAIASAPVDVADVPMIKESIRVTKLSLNDVSTELFSLEFPPGLEVVDFNKTVINPKTGNQVGSVLVVNQDGSLSEKRFSPKVEIRPGNQGWNRIILITLNVIVALTLIGFVRRGRRNTT